MTVNGLVTGRIGNGLVALIGIRPDDSQNSAERLVQRVPGYRLFEDDQGRMSLDVQAVVPSGLEV